MHHHGVMDFDFLLGEWRVRNRRLRTPLAESQEWYEFESTCREMPLLEGSGNIEHYDAPSAPGGPIYAIAVRLYGANTGQWRIYWSRAGSGAFDVPMLGSFEDGVGRFFSREDFQGRQIAVRFIWTHSGDSACRWEQAFSAGEGERWETNWIMDFTRVAA